jgi:hypothetical protein
MTFVYVISFKEYRDVIRERFGAAPSQSTGEVGT